MPFHRRAGLPAALAALLLATAAAPAGPAAVSGQRPAALTFTVNSFADLAAAAPLDKGACETVPGNQQCTLRAAIMKANHYPGGGVTILLPAGTYTLTIASSGLDDETTGDLNITSTVTLNGAGAAATIIDANQLDRVIRVDGGMATLANVTLRNGRVSGAGGGLENFGAVTLNNVVIRDNQVHGNAGGVYNGAGASLTLTNSAISGNRTTAFGDAGGVTNSGVMNMADSLISGNQASGRGGGLANFNVAVLTMTNSTVSNNSAVYGGGGFYNDGPSVINTYFSTVAGNLADSGATAAGPGGGIDNLGTINLRATLLAQNYAGATPSDGFGAFNSLDYNLIQTTTNFTPTGVTLHNLTGLNPLLDVAHDNGGPTPTRALLPSSPALDALPTNQCLDPLNAPLTVDQRGFPRPLNGACDIGAYEGHLPGPTYFRNLVRNGDAEAAAGSPAGAFVGLPGWTNSGTLMTALPYNAPGGFPSVPTDTVPANHGDNFFAGGVSAGAGGNQTIDLSPFAGFIDTGGVSYDFSADLGGYLDQGDNAMVEADFRDQSSALLTQVFLGPVTAADRGNLTGLLHRETSAPVRAGTRSVQLFVTLSMVNGPYNDGYADNIALMLLPPDALYLPLVQR